MKNKTYLIHNGVLFCLDPDALRALRTERALSVRACATEMGIEFQKLWGWENGRAPRPDGVATLRKYYGKHLDGVLVKQ